MVQCQFPARAPRGHVLQIRCLIQFNAEFAQTFLRRDKKPSFRVYQYAILIPQEKLAYDLFRLTPGLETALLSLSTLPCCHHMPSLGIHVQHKDAFR